MAGGGQVSQKMYQCLVHGSCICWRSSLTELLISVRILIIARNILSRLRYNINCYTTYSGTLTVGVGVVGLIGLFGSNLDCNGGSLVAHSSLTCCENVSIGPIISWNNEVGMTVSRCWEGVE